MAHKSDVTRIAEEPPMPSYCELCRPPRIHPNPTRILARARTCRAVAYPLARSVRSSSAAVRPCKSSGSISSCTLIPCRDGLRLFSLSR